VGEPICLEWGGETESTILQYNCWVQAGLLSLQVLTTVTATLGLIITQLEKRGLSAVNRTAALLRD
jgi:hypothetical protein